MLYKEMVGVVLVTMSEKIERAKKLCANKDRFEEFNKGLSIFNDVTMNSLYGPVIRVEAIKALFEIAPDEANDKLNRARSALMFLEDENRLNDELTFLCLVAKDKSVNCHERIMIAVELYNNHFIDLCYPCFRYLCKDVSVNVENRVEATRFLIYSEDEKNYKCAMDTLVSIVSDVDYPSKFRYKTIASFNSKTGLSTKYNRVKLNVEYDEKLLYRLQSIFFFEERNDVRNRLLSGQHLLQMTVISPDNENGVISKEERNRVSETILDVATTYEHDDPNEQYNCRADAADIVVRLGCPEHRLTAQRIIGDLGDDKKAFGSSTVYNNAQNIHDTKINDSINQFIVEVVEKNANKDVETYPNTQTAITNYIYTLNLEPKDSFKAFKSLSRISMDTATFTKYHVNSAMLLVHIWTYIVSLKDEDTKALLKQRMVDELIDMSATCSTGHAGRLVNVLNGYGFELKISWKDQVVANANARMQTRMRNIKDDDERGTVVCGMNKDLADEDEREAYVKFITDNTESLRKELYDEFVGGGYIDEKEFETLFTEAVDGWHRA